MTEEKLAMLKGKEITIPKKPFSLRKLIRLLKKKKKKNAQGGEK